MLYVVNAVGTADKQCPSGYSGWLDLWEKTLHKKAKYCRHCRKEINDLVGGHVQKANRHPDGSWYRIPGLYITPICKECNNSQNNYVFQVAEEDLLPVE